MKVITIANQKGGVGKTAIAVHLAWHLQKLGKKLLFIDFDTQRNASYTLRESKDLSLKAIDLLNKTEVDLNYDFSFGVAEASNLLLDIKEEEIGTVINNLKRNIDALNVDFVIIDTPPTLGVVLAAALLCSDYVFSPIEMETYSLQGIEQMLRTINNIKKTSPKLEYLGMVPSKFDRRNPRQIVNYEYLKTNYSNFLIDKPIGLRSSVADSLTAGHPVWQIKKTAARVATKEFENLFSWLLPKII